MSRKMTKYAVFNNKGGVGKSTIAVHIAHGLALSGCKVLLVDMDGQNDASLFLGFTSQDYKKTFYDLIAGTNKTKLEECLIHARDNLDLLPSSSVDMIHTELFRLPRINFVLKEFVADDHLLTGPIHRRVKIAEAGKLGKTVFEYDDESAQQFLSIVKKVISKNAQEEQ